MPLDVAVRYELPNYPQQQSKERDFRDGGTDTSLGIAEQGGGAKIYKNFSAELL